MPRELYWIRSDSKRANTIRAAHRGQRDLRRRDSGRRRRYYRYVLPKEAKKVIMKITYDSEVDVLYIEFRDAPGRDSMDIEEDGVRVDLDEDGHIVGIEFLDASERLSPKELSHVS